MCGPFCSVPPVGMMIVVFPRAIASRTSIQVSSSRKTLSGRGSEGACANAGNAAYATATTAAHAKALIRVVIRALPYWLRERRILRRGSAPRKACRRRRPAAARQQKADRDERAASVRENCGHARSFPRPLDKAALLHSSCHYQLAHVPLHVLGCMKHESHNGRGQLLPSDKARFVQNVRWHRT